MKIFNITINEVLPPKDPGSSYNQTEEVFKQVVTALDDEDGEDFIKRVIKAINFPEPK